MDRHDFIAQLAAILKTTEKNAPTRAAKMQLFPVCDRCGGTGRYSFNGSHSVCYKCHGDRCVFPNGKQYKAVLVSATGAFEDGTLHRYLEVLRVRQEAKNARDVVLKAWGDTGVSKLYDWRKAVKSHPEFNERDAEIAAINKIMSDAYQTVADVSWQSEIDWVSLRDAMNTALQKIAEGNKMLDDYR